MVQRRKRVEAIGYMRTSSTANIGDGKDSETRQRKTIEDCLWRIWSVLTRVPNAIACQVGQ